MFAGNLTHARLLVLAEWEKRMRKLLLGKSEEKIGLVLAGIGRPLEDPPAAFGIIMIACIVARRNHVSADLPRCQQQLIELQVVVAE